MKDGGLTQNSGNGGCMTSGTSGILEILVTEVG